MFEEAAMESTIRKLVVPRRRIIPVRTLMLRDSALVRALERAARDDNNTLDRTAEKYIRRGLNAAGYHIQRKRE